MNTRIRITCVLGAFSLLSAVNSQAALLDFTNAADFETALANLGFAVETRAEGFEPEIGGVPTPWEPAKTPSYLSEVSNLGIRWFHTNIDNRFSVGTLGGSTHEGQYGMFLPSPSTDMSYALEKETGFKLVAFGGWFRDSNGGAKPTFMLDGDRQVAVGPPLGTGWEFRGFIDDDPNGGFTQVFVTESEGLPGGETEFFATDDVTLAAHIPLPAALPLFGTALLGIGFMGRRRQKK